MQKFKYDIVAMGKGRYVDVCVPHPYPNIVHLPAVIWAEIPLFTSLGFRFWGWREFSSWALNHQLCLRESGGGADLGDYRDLLVLLSIVVGKVCKVSFISLRSLSLLLCCCWWLGKQRISGEVFTVVTRQSCLPLSFGPATVLRGWWDWGRSGG